MQRWVNEVLKTIKMKYRRVDTIKDLEENREDLVTDGVQGIKIREDSKINPR